MNIAMCQISYGSDTSELNNYFFFYRRKIWPKAGILERSRISRGIAREDGVPCIWGKTMQNIKSVSHLSLFAGSYFAVLQIRRGAAGVKIHHPDRSIDRSSRTVRQLDQVFQTYCVMFRGSKGWGREGEAAPITAFLQRKEKQYEALNILILYIIRATILHI